MLQNTTGFTPVGTFLLLRALEKQEKSAGGIYFPETSQKNFNQGVVIDQGGQVDTEMFPLGAHVLFSQHSEYRVELDGQEHIAVTVENVILVKANASQERNAQAKD